METSGINNAFYDELGEGWYAACEHPVALLRAENALRAPWISVVIESKLGKNCSVLDVGCGAGFLSNTLARAGHQVTGIDLSPSSLQVAEQQDSTKSVRYMEANACALPFDAASFDVVCALDLLEHVEQPERVIQEASRVLRPGGLFFFHTFNRNWWSWLVVIKGVEWAVKNTPKNMHVYNLFIKPEELKALCQEAHIGQLEMRGLKPKLCSVPTLRMLLTRKVPVNFQFEFSSSLLTGYIGVGKKLP